MRNSSLTIVRQYRMEPHIPSHSQDMPSALQNMQIDLMTTSPFQSSSESSATHLSELLIIRHGERADQVPSDPWHHSAAAIARPKDTPLTAHGRCQARSVGDHLCKSGVQANVIYCSPLRRCLETACEIAHALKLPIKIVVPLAKPCHYFRLCARDGIKPLFPSREEAKSILYGMYKDVELADFQHDDGATSQETMERLVAQSKKEQPNATIPQTIIVGHCEAQKAMAKMIGLKKTMEAPYCGVAVFELERPVGEEVNWSLAMTPRTYEKLYLRR